MHGAFISHLCNVIFRKPALRGKYRYNILAPEIVKTSTLFMHETFSCYDGFLTSPVQPIPFKSLAVITFKYLEKWKKVLRKRFWVELSSFQQNEIERAFMNS